MAGYKQLLELTLAPGIMTEETDRGAVSRYKTCDKIRFRQLLPEKIGGWILSSLGTEDGDLDLATTQFTGLSGTYIATATTIPLESAFTVVDGDPIWLFGTSITGVWGTNFISDAINGIEGSFVFFIDAVATAAIGDAFVIEYPDEFGGADDVASGGTTGSVNLVVTTPITTYLKAGTVIRIDLTAGGPHWTILKNDILSGATAIVLRDPLPAPVDNAGALGLRMFVRTSDMFDTTANVSYVVRFLAQVMPATTTVRLTESLPADADLFDINIFPFEAVSADGAQVSTTSLLVTPGSANGNADGSAFPESFVVAPQFQQDEICYLGEARALHDWADLENEIWLAIGTHEKLYVVNNGVLFDITPIRDSGVLAGPFDTTAGDQTVIVNDAAHGTQPGDYVTYSGAAITSGIDFNQEFQVATVIDAGSYTIEAPFPATTTVLGGGGAVSFEYQIAIGSETSVTVFGWGTGAYGGGFYGIGQAGVGITVPARIWALDNFGEDLLASPNGSTLYHWDRTTGPSARAVVVPTAPNTIQWMIVSPQSRHTIAFGAGTGSQSVPGEPDKLLIRWSDQESFSIWDPTSENLAGDIRLDVGSEIITATESRGDILVWTDESLHALQFVGGTFVFGLRHLGQSVKIIGPNAAVDANGIVYFMGEDDFLVYDGTLRVMPCDVRNQVFDDLNRAQGSKVFGAVNKLFTEVWWFYPSLASETNDRYVKYNYKDKVWDFGTITRTAFHDSSAFLGQKPYGTFDGKLYQHETGTDEADEVGVLQPMISFLETYDVEIDPSGSYLMHVREMIPDFKSLTGSIDLTLNGRGYPQRASLTTTGPFVVTASTEKVDLRFRTRQVSFEVRSDALGDDWRMGTWRAAARPHGRRGG